MNFRFKNTGAGSRNLHLLVFVVRSLSSIPFSLVSKVYEGVGQIEGTESSLLFVIESFVMERSYSIFLELELICGES